MHNTCITHGRNIKTRFFWVDIDLAIQKGLTFYQTRLNAIILQRKLPAYCIPTVVKLKTGEVLYEKAYMSPRQQPKISLRHNWARGEVPLGSTVDQQPEREVVQQSQEEVARRAKFFQSTQPIPRTICDRSGQPDNTQDVFVNKVETSHVRLKKARMSELNKLSIDQGNLINTTSQYKKTLKYIMRSRRSTPTMS